MSLLTIFVIKSDYRPDQWLQTCLKSLQHTEIKIHLIKGTSTLNELLQLRLALPYLAKTKYMAFVDDDDWIDPNHIAPMLKILEEGTWGGIYSNETVVSIEGRIIGHRDSFMKVFDPQIHHRRLIDTHHLTIINTELAKQAVDKIPKDDIYLEPLIYGLVGLVAPLVHYPYRTYFWRMSTLKTTEKIKTQNLATKNASMLYRQHIQNSTSNFNREIQ